MDVRISSDTTSLPEGTAIVVIAFKGDPDARVAGLSSDQNDEVQRLRSQGARIGELYESTFLAGKNGGPSVLVVGGGPVGDLSPLLISRLAAQASRQLTGMGFRSLAYVLTSGTAPESVTALTEGAVDGSYNTGLLKTRERRDRSLDTVTIVASSPAGLDEAARRGQIVGESRAIARDLVNLPPNEITPAGLADRAGALAQQYGLAVDTLDDNALREGKFGAILGVAQGSAQPPRLIVLRYGDPNAGTRLALVGKGLTFDSGGLSIKTGEGMMTMKSDMSGGAAVIGAMVAIARLAPKNIAVTGYVGATENMTGSAAMRPGDVLTAHSGETIEVLNTDAEGRLVLADVLAYAVEEGATHIVDIATLTGAAFVALGGGAAMATGTPDDWVRRVVEAGDEGLDRCWPMPLYPEYRRQMDSEIADIKNIGNGRGGGALTAASFLGDFHGDVPWAHLDIAGMAFTDTPLPYRAKGATGFGVGAFVALAMNMARQ
jgi:leucyl aminopeptidase